MCKLKTSLSKKFGYNLQTFRGFCQEVRFTILLQILQENNFLSTSKHLKQVEVRRFLGICLYDCSIYRSNKLISSSENFSKRDSILASVAKQWKAKDIPSYGSQSKRAKIAIHWLVKYPPLATSTSVHE